MTHLKKTFCLGIILLFSISLLQAQNHQNGLGKHKGKCQYRERINKERIAYITTKVDFTVEEAQKFWPIYNTFEKETHRLRKEQKKTMKRIKEEGLSEQDYQDILDQIRQNKKQTFALEQNFDQELRRILSAKKILLLHEAEKDFKRSLVHSLRKGKWGCEAGE